MHISHVPQVSYNNPRRHENDCRPPPPLFFFCKSHVCNSHLSVWKVSTESHGAARQEVQGGSSYLTCSRYATTDWELPLLNEGDLLLTINTKRCQSWTELNLFFFFSALLVSLGWLFFFFLRQVLYIFTQTTRMIYILWRAAAVNTALSSWQFTLTRGAGTGPFDQTGRQLVFFLKCNMSVLYFGTKAVLNFYLDTCSFRTSWRTL